MKINKKILRFSENVLMVFYAFSHSMLALFGALIVTALLEELTGIIVGLEMVRIVVLTSFFGTAGFRLIEFDAKRKMGEYYDRD